MSKKKGLGKLLVGIGIGVGFGFLFAPKKGSETRKDLKLKLDELLEKIKKADPSEIRENIITKINEIQEELKELDKAKILKIAKKQASNIQNKAEELYAYAIKKGTPILKKATDDIRLQAIKVAEEVIIKLENPKAKKLKK